MRSFQQPWSWWQHLAQKLDTPLCEISELNSQLPQLEAQLHDACERIARARILDEANQAQWLPPGGYAPYSPIEALSFYQRLHIGAQADTYQEVVQRIHREHEQLEWSLEEVVRIHGRIWAVDTPWAGRWKEEDNILPHFSADGRELEVHATVPPEEVEAAMRQFFELFDAHWRDDRHHKLLLIAGLMLDMFQIHPFSDGNGRTTRLMCLWQLYRSGYRVFRYTSIEAAFSRRRNEYLAALMVSSRGWHEAEHDMTSWAKFTIELVRSSYLDFAESVTGLVALAAQAEQFDVALRALPESFDKQDLLRQQPLLAPALVDLFLNRRRDRGELTAEIVEGRIVWQRVREPLQAAP